MPEPKWSLRGEYMESCNCDYLCPCTYTNPQEAATHDHCTAVMVFRIDEGHLGETKLVVRRNHRIPFSGGVCDNARCARGSISR